MAFYNQASEIALNVARVFTGRSIYVRASTGSDSTGDGSEGFPYATLTRAFQDVVSGRGDKVIWINEGSSSSAPHREAGPLIVSNKDSWALIGLGSPFLGQHTGAITQPSAEVALTFVTSNTVDVNIPSHGMVVNDKILLHGYTESGSNRVNGFWSVASVIDANNVRLTALTVHTQVPGGGGGNEPFASADTGRFTTPMALEVNQCQNVVVAGVGFANASGSVNNGMSGCLVTGDLNIASRADNVQFLNCQFFNALLGFVRIRRLGIVFSLSNPGTRFLVEGCTFGRQWLGSFVAWRAVFPQLALDGMVDFVANRNSFLGDDGDFGLVAGQGLAVRYYGREPVLGWLFGLNIFLTNKVFGGAGGLYDLAHAGIGDVDVDKIRFSRNFYTAEVGEQTVEVSASAGKVDREAAPFVNSDVLPQLDDLIWGREIPPAADRPDTVGEALVRTVYRGQIHIDTTGGGTPGTQVGINGTPENAVDNLADAVTLAAATGIDEYHVHGSITLTTDHVGFRFAGNDPLQDIVTVNTGVDVTDCSFNQVGIRGDLGGFPVSGTSCILGESGGTLENINGVFSDSGFRGTLEVAANSVLRGITLASQEIGTPGIIDLQNANAQALILNLAGNVRADNMAANNVFGTVLSGGILEIGASSTGGVVQVAGHGDFVNNGTVTVLRDDVIRGALLDVAVSTLATDADIDVLAAILEGRTRINRSNPAQWTEEHFDRTETGAATTVIRTYNLFDQDGNAINDANNWLSDPSVRIHDRQRV